MNCILPRFSVYNINGENEKCWYFYSYTIYYSSSGKLLHLKCFFQKLFSFFYYFKITLFFFAPWCAAFRFTVSICRDWLLIADLFPITIRFRLELLCRWFSIHRKLFVNIEWIIKVSPHFKTFTLNRSREKRNMRQCACACMCMCLNWFHMLYISVISQ